MSRTNPDLKSARWVLVAGGFHQQGGMDKANAALAEYLIANQIPVELVAHQISPEFLERPEVSTHIVPRPAGSTLLGELLLEKRGRSAAEKVVATYPGSRVVVNGGNCNWPDINWVHSVHRYWPCVDHRSPIWFKIKNRLNKTWSRRREKSAIGAARTVIVNSYRTRRDLITAYNLD